MPPQEVGGSDLQPISITRGHHAALPRNDMPAFMADFARRDSTSTRALAFCISTGEVLRATWPEIDLEAGVWTAPAKRMKAGAEHHVPLSKAAITLLTAMRRFRSKPYAFPGQRQGEPLSNMAMLALLARMKHDAITVHGFRSTFRDCAGELTDFPRELAEQALAHTIVNKVEAACRRGGSSRLGGSTTTLSDPIRASAASRRRCSQAGPMRTKNQPGLT